MVRQIAIGAVIAFGATVLALSLWSPDETTPASPEALAPVTVLETHMVPVVVAAPMAQALKLAAVDGGVSGP